MLRIGPSSRRRQWTRPTTVTSNLRAAACRASIQQYGCTACVRNRCDPNRLADSTHLTAARELPTASATRAPASQNPSDRQSASNCPPGLLSLPNRLAHRLNVTERHGRGSRGGNPSRGLLDRTRSRRLSPVDTRSEDQYACLTLEFSFIPTPPTDPDGAGESLSTAQYLLRLPGVLP